MESPLHDTWLIVVLAVFYLALCAGLWLSLGSAARAVRPIAEHALNQAMVNAALSRWW